MNKPVFHGTDGHRKAQADHIKAGPPMKEGSGQGGKASKYKGTTTYKNDEKTSAETESSKKNLAQKIFGGQTNKTSTTSRGAEDVNFTRSSTKTKEDRKGRTRKKVTVGPKGKKTVTRYKKDGTVKSSKVKKGTHTVNANTKRMEQDAIRTADKPGAPMKKGDTDFFDKVKSAANAVGRNLGKVNTNSSTFSDKVSASYKKNKKQYREKAAKKQGAPMKAGMSGSKKVSKETKRKKALRGAAAAAGFNGGQGPIDKFIDVVKSRGYFSGKGGNR